MARPRKPTAVLELTGQFKRHPERKRSRANEPKPTGSLGGPPPGLSTKERACWSELVSLAAPGVLKNSDRWLVEIASRLMAKVREKGIGGASGATIGELSQLNQCLIRMAMTPADRSKVHVPEEAEGKDTFEELAKEGTGKAPRVN